jgi:hypothetical protein
MALARSFQEKETSGIISEITATIFDYVRRAKGSTACFMFYISPMGKDTWGVHVGTERPVLTFPKSDITI